MLKKISKLLTFNFKRKFLGFYIKIHEYFSCTNLFFLDKIELLFEIKK